MSNLPYLQAADRFLMKVMEHPGYTADMLRFAANSTEGEDDERQIQHVRELLTQNSEALTAFD